MSNDHTGLRRLIPSTSMLTAFDAAARHLNFTRAGEELALTQSAVSRQIAALENLLGVALFQRKGRLLELTETGRLYALDLAPALARVHGATSRALAFQGGTAQLRLSALPSFTSTWLMPRLAAFHALHPEILVHIHARSGEYALEDTSFDAAINVGIAPFPHLVAHRLIAEEVIMVGSPEALARMPVRVVEDVSRHRLLHNANRLEAWREWFDRQRVPVRGMRAGAQFDVTLHLIQAATAGLGLALVARFLVEAELASGLLAQVPVPGLESGRAYYLLHPPEKTDHAPLAAFRDWIGAQAVRPDQPSA